MYFYEVVAKCDEGVLINEFLAMCSESPDTQKTKECFCAFLESVKALTPKLNDKATIICRRVNDFKEGETYDSVNALFEGENESYSLLGIPWAELLGYKADESCVHEYGEERFAALVMWEMTWFGYDEQTVNERIAKMGEDC